MRFDPDAMRGRQLYTLMTSLITPRPIAWTGSRSAQGIDNLAPFSYFMGVSSSPPAVAISVARAGRDDRGGWRLKDTARNILGQGDFTVSIVPRRLAQEMADSSAPWPSNRSEFDAVGVAPVQGQRVAACFPEGAPITLECRLIHSHDLGTAHLLVGQVLLFHVDDAVLRPLVGPLADGQVDPVSVDAIARLGGQDYSTLGERFTLVPRSPSGPDGVD